MDSGEAKGTNRTGNPDFDYNGMFQVCVEKGKQYVQSSGVWFKDNPFDFVLPLTLLQIFLFIVVSRLIYFVLRPLRTPKFVCSLLGGILLGPSGLGQIKAFRELIYPPRQSEILSLTSSLAVAYFIFIIAMKMDAYTNMKSVKRTWKFGLLPFLSSFWVMSGVTYLFSLGLLSGSFPDADDMTPIRIMVFVTTSITSFPVISESLLELQLITSELGQIALSASMLNEIMHWIIIAVSTVLQNRNTKHALQFVFGSISINLFCFLVIRPVTMKIARTTPPGKPVKEGFVVTIQLGVLVLGFISDLLGLNFLQGPLLMGLVMPSGPPLATTVEERTEAIISNFLLPLFFFCVGVRIDVRTIQNWEMIFKVQLIIIAGFMAKVVACVLISLTYQMKLKHGIVLGLMLNIKGMIDLIFFSRMRRLQMMDDQILAHMVLSVMGVTTIVSPLIEVLYNPQSRLEKLSNISTKILKSVQSTPGNSELRIISCVHKEGEVRSMIALLEALNPSHATPMCVYVIHLIQLLGQSTPILRRIDINKKSSRLLSYPNTSHIMRAFDNFARNSTRQGSLVTVVPCINVAPYNTMHDSICNLAQDNCVPLIILPFHQNNDTHDHRTAASVRELNANFQDYAPCTVGILVDRYSRLGLSSASFLSFHVGVLFIGGADDREALALAMRMWERENMSMEVLRLVVWNEKGEDEEERRVDERLIDELRAKKAGRGGVRMEEVVVEAWEKVFEGIRRWEGKYDLVMVGRKHKMGSFNDEEMSNFIENAEMLGMVGDMLASTEFCNGMVPVLVVQCGGRRVW